MNPIHFNLTGGVLILGTMIVYAAVIGFSFT